MKKKIRKKLSAMMRLVLVFTLMLTNMPIGAIAYAQEAPPTTTQEANEVPSILITEMTPHPAGDYRVGSGNQYEMLEIYNNSDEVLNLEGHSLLYIYTDRTFKDWTFPEETAIEPHSTAVIWFIQEAMRDGVTDVADFNTHYNVNLSEDDIIIYDNSPSSEFNLPNSTNRGLAIASSPSIDDIIVEAKYNSTANGPDRKLNEVRNSSIIYQYPESGTVMERVDIRDYATPGNLEAGQVPEVEGKDLFAPIITHEQPFNEIVQGEENIVTMTSNEELAQASLLYGTAEGDLTDYAHSVPMELENSNDGNYTYSATLQLDEVGSYRYMIETADAAGNVTKAPYNSRGNSFTVTEAVDEVVPDPEDEETTGPEILITEMTPHPAGDYRVGSGNQYEMLELYNNSNEVLNLKDHSLLYIYTDRTFKDWTFPEDTAIEPYSTAVIWFIQEAKRDGVTDVADFNTHYNVDLSEDDIIIYDNSPSAEFNLPNSTNRGLAIASSPSIDDIIVEAKYNSTANGPDRKLNNVRNSAIIYQYPESGTVMERVDIRDYSTPGNLEAGQVPEVDGLDLSAPVINHEQTFQQFEKSEQQEITIESSEELEQASFIYGPEVEGQLTDFSNSLDLEFVHENNGQYTYSAMLEVSEENSYQYMIVAEDFGGNVTKVPYNSLGNSFSVYDQENYEVPEILITEMTPHPAGDHRMGWGNQYEVMEIYNNSDEVLNLNGYSLMYLYPNNSPAPRSWTMTEDTAIEPYSTAVVWFAQEAIRDGYTEVEDVNMHFNVDLAEDDIIFYDNSDGGFNLPNATHRGLAISSSDSADDIIIEAWYDSTAGGADRMLNDVRNGSIIYQYPAFGREMVRMDIRPYGTPGNLEEGQVPVEEGMDVFAPAIDHKQAFYRIEKGQQNDVTFTSDEELTHASFIYGPAEAADFAHTIEMDLIDTDDGLYTYSTTLQFDELGTYRYMIVAEDHSGNTTRVPYNSLGNEFSVIEDEIGLDLPEPGLSLEPAEILNDKLSFFAYGEESTDDLTVTLNGEEISGARALPGEAEFSFQGSGIDYIYHAATSAINPDGERDYISRIRPIYVSDAWYTYDIAPTYFIADQKVSVHSGSENVSYDLDTHDEHFNTANFDDFDLINLHLVLPDGTTVIPETVRNYLGNRDQTVLPYQENTYYVFGDGNAPNNTNMTKPMKTDFMFDIPEEKLTAMYYEVDTTSLADGEYELVFEMNNETVETTNITIDNTAPVIDKIIDNEGNEITDGESLKGDIELSVEATDDLSGIDRIEAFINGAEVAYPVETSSAILEEGQYELKIIIYDNAGNSAQTQISFVINPESPEAPTDLAPSDRHEDVGEDATLSGRVTDPSEDTMDVTFYQGKKYDFAANEGIEGFSNVADREPPLTIADEGEVALSAADEEKIAHEDGEYLVNDSTMGFPYHRFEITVEEELTASDTVEIYWKGKTLPNRIVTLYAWDYLEEEWVAQVSETGNASEDDITLTAELEQDRFIRDGKIQAMIQDEIEDPNDPFNILWMTDTQLYAQEYHYIWDGLGDWIVDEYNNGLFEYLIHSGDLVNKADSDEQWAVADRNLQKFDDANLPYGVLAGNHDAIIDGVDYSYYHKYVGADRYEDNPWYGGSMDNNRNHYDLMSFGGHDFIITYIGFGLEDTPETIEWANNVLEQHADRNAIVVLHAYLEGTGRLSNMSQTIFDEIVVPNENVKMVLGGHYHGAVNRMSEIENEDGSTRQVLEMLSNYQAGPNGGDGYVRFLSFDPIAGELTVDTYSPILDDYHYFDPEVENFTVDFDFADTNKRVATDYFSVNVYSDEVIGVDEGVSSGDFATTEWTGLAPNETYYWYMDIADEFDANHRSDIFSFTTGDFPVDEEVPGDDDNLKELLDLINDLSDRIEELERNTTVQEGQIESLEAQLAAVQAQFNELDSQTAELEQRIDELERLIEDLRTGATQPDEDIVEPGEDIETPGQEIENPKEDTETGPDLGEEDTSDEDSESGSDDAEVEDLPATGESNPTILITAGIVLVTLGGLTLIIDKKRNKI